MERKDYITLDGRMDEAAWASAKEFTGFQKLKRNGGGLAEVQTVVKVLPMEDRVYFGFMCLEPDMQQVIDSHPKRGIWSTDRIELFLSPSGGTFDYYQFMVTFGGKAVSNYYSEGGQIQPDPYAPQWNSAVFVGEDYWSMVIELPLTAFYMTANDNMSDKWLMGVIRCRTYDRNELRGIESSCCKLDRDYVEFDKYLTLDGMPMRPAQDDIRIISANPDIKEKDETGYRGTMLIKTLNPVADTFTFTSNYGETTTVTLKAGTNEFTVPCRFEKLGRHSVSLELTRAGDGKQFKRYYPVTATYEPIKLRFTLPEYRCNFYPGQDYSKIVGSVIAAKPVTLKLEGPGIETQVISPAADGSFAFETPNFEVGEAWLTATIDGEEKKQKIRRLAPTGHMMTWVSGGNLIVNGEPVLARYMFAPTYLGSKVFRQRHDAENFYETRHVTRQPGFLQADYLLEKMGLSSAETMQDVMPSQVVLDAFDKQIAENKDKDYAFNYIYDEPECVAGSPIYIKNAYEYIAERDPYHVAVIATREAARYVECADWFQTHPYIAPENLEDGRRVYQRPMNTIGSFIDDIVKQNRPDKIIGFLPTAFTYEFQSRYADYPNLDEIICHTWAAMIRGGKSLTPYAFHDMNDRPAVCEGMRYIFSTFEALERIVLLGKRTVLLRTQDAEAVLYDNGDERMFVLVNFNPEPQTVTVDGISGTWHEFRRNRTITGNTFELKPFEVVVGTNVVKDTGLPTYEEVAALIDEQEYVRTHSGSLLFACQNDVTVTSSGVANACKYKMFDGVRDNLALQVQSKGERFYEVELTKVKPSFSKVVVSGWNLKSNVALKVRMDGNLVAPEIAEVKTEELSVTFLLKEAICPDALHLAFTGDESMEVYEIEAF